MEVRNNSQLVVGHIQLEYEARDERMTHYLTGVEACLDKLVDWRDAENYTRKCDQCQRHALIL